MLLRALLCALFLSFAAPAQAKVTLGVALGTPEIFGLYVSFFPAAEFSIDLRPTLSTIDLGLTGHFKMGGDADHSHNLLASFVAGYVHRGVHVYYDGAGPRLSGMVGYGYASAWDFRLLGGVTSYDYGNAWTTTPAFVAMLGHAL